LWYNEETDIIEIKNHETQEITEVAIQGLIDADLVTHEDVSEYIEQVITEAL
jgi:hypothetical protein